MRRRDFLRATSGAAGLLAAPSIGRAADSKVLRFVPQANLANLEHQLGQGGEAEVKLQQLQRDADGTRSAYDAYLSRFKEISEQQQLQTPDGYLISAATRPDSPTYPRGSSVLMLGVIVGALGGIALAFLREMFDGRLRSVAQVEGATGLPVVAVMPAFSRFVGLLKL